MPLLCVISPCCRHVQALYILIFWSFAILCSVKAAADLILNSVNLVIGKDCGGHLAQCFSRGIDSFSCILQNLGELPPLFLQT